MIKLYNTLTRQKEEFKPGEPNKVRMYVCGPTTYNCIHLGNARPLVVFDTVRRYLKYKGYDVLYIQNFTDIDDKIIKRANEENIDARALAEKYISEYFKDADALNVKRADHYPKVSEHIDDIIAAIKKLIDKDYAYVIDGDVYFNVRKYEDYGKLSGRSLDEMKSGARVQIDERKKDPLDFALWKSSKPGEPSWDSPWGKGRPGWHIECSVMSTKYLGETFDIHGGGADLIFPHHENEIAQAEACTDCQFARYWMHNGFITVNKEKMSKSLGNFFLVREILQKFSGDTVRFYLLSTHYRSPLDFDNEKLAMNEKSLQRIKNTFALLEQTLNKKPVAGNGDSGNRILKSVDQLVADFESAMDDDFNTALALAAVFEFCKEMNITINDESFRPDKDTLQALEKARDTLYKLAGGILGIIFKAEDTAASDDLVSELVQILIEVRQNARKNKDWTTADTIRDRLKECGIILEDSPQGTRWKKS
ncbi:MAG: cysteinyl-tRNA synthetase [Clostridiales bacterium]|nr:cysteinyl-tRNA synthetase [Clostridiales bacterium]